MHAATQSAALPAVFTRGPRRSCRRAPLRVAPRADAASGDKPALKRWPEEVSPAGVPLPPVKPSKKLPVFGFVDNAETMNSRAAMIGFFALIALEAIANKPFLTMLGVEIGNGIDIGF